MWHRRGKGILHLSHLPAMKVECSGMSNETGGQYIHSYSDVTREIAVVHQAQIFY